jgi:hypothetical protein
MGKKQPGFGAKTRKSIFMRQNPVVAAAPRLDFPGVCGRSSRKKGPNIVGGSAGLILRHSGIAEVFATGFVRSKGFCRA